MKRNWYGVGAAVLSNVIFGFGILAGKVVMNESSPFMMLACRFSLAWLVMTILSLFKIVPLDLRKPELKLLVLLGIFQPTLNFIFESYGVALTSVSFSGTVLAASPLGALLLAVIVLKERSTAKQVFWSVVCVGGVVMLSVSNISEGGASFLGILFLLGEVATLAIYSVLSKKLSDTFTPFERTYVMQTVGAIVYTTVVAIHYKGHLIPTVFGLLQVRNFVLGIVFLGIASSIGGICLQNFALGKLPVGEATIFNSLMTVVSVFAGVVFLSEPFGAVQVVGAVLILVGIYRIAVSAKVQEHTPQISGYIRIDSNR